MEFTVFNSKIGHNEMWVHNFQKIVMKKTQKVNISSKLSAMAAETETYCEKILKVLKIDQWKA